jgi:hypothetical protein
MTGSTRVEVPGQLTLPLCSTLTEAERSSISFRLELLSAWAQQVTAELSGLLSLLTAVGAVSTSETAQS